MYFNIVHKEGGLWQKPVKILEPHFITFYNGSRDMKEDKQINEQSKQLSDQQKEIEHLKKLLGERQMIE